jgi:hypothetical protein
MKRVFKILFFLFNIYSAKCQKLGYGYVPRDSVSDVNWNKIGTEINNSLKEAQIKYLENLKSAGWASEEDYLAYRREQKKIKKNREKEIREEAIENKKKIKKQKNLQKKYNNGDPNVLMFYDKNSNPWYYELYESTN